MPRKERWSPKAKSVRRATPKGGRLNTHPIEIQGLQIRRGEPILVVVGGQSFEHYYAGECDGEYWTAAIFTTAVGRGPGPYKLDDFRHVDILTAFAKELSKGD